MLAGETSRSDEFHVRLREQKVLSKLLASAMVVLSEDDFFKVADLFLAFVELDEPEKQMVRIEQKYSWLRERYPTSDRTFSEALLVIASGGTISQRSKDKRR